MENNTLNTLLISGKTHIKNLENLKNVHIVLGNETCDLDSAVSSLVYSLLLHHLNPSKDNIVIPVFNIPREQLPIKTEVTYLLKKYGINLDIIICRDDINLEILQNNGVLQLTLVDHHVLQDNQLISCVVAVIDHRQPDPAWPWLNVECTMNIVGSCCTLIAEKLLSQAPELVTPMISSWLLGTILLDTACLSPEVGRATPLDLKMVAQLQNYCPQTLNQEQFYNELQAAKSDISTLTATQLLIKDLKIASGIPIAGLPLKVQEFLQRHDAIYAVKQFCEDHNVETCVIYGQKVEAGSLTRDIAVFDLNNKGVASQVVAALVNCKEPYLNLQVLPCPPQGFTLFEQFNIKATRKQILPIVQQVAEFMKKNNGITT